MITEIFFTVFFFIINTIFSILPNFPNIPTGLLDGLASVFSLIGTVGYFIPLGTLSTVMITIFLAYNIKIVMDIISWVLKKIPTMSG